jgi:hypothetical protein
MGTWRSRARHIYRVLPEINLISATTHGRGDDARKLRWREDLPEIVLLLACPGVQTEELVQCIFMDKKRKEICFLF